MKTKMFFLFIDFHVFKVKPIFSELFALNTVIHCTDFQECQDNGQICTWKIFNKRQFNFVVIDS